MSVRAHSILIDLVEAARLKLAAGADGWNDDAKVIISPYPVAQHDGEEDCCKGLLIGTIERLYVSTRFPQESDLTNPCQAHILVMDASITVVRCAPKGPRDGKVPVARLNDATARAWRDAAAVWEGVRCALLGVDPDLDWGFRDQILRPDEEGCIGTDLRFAVGIFNGCDPC